MKRAAEDDQGGARKRLSAGEAVFHGTIRSMDHVSRSSLIDCAEIHRQSGKAVVASNSLVRQSMAGLQDTVCFFLRWSSEGPQASPPMLRLRCEDNFALLGRFRTGAAGYGFVSCDLMTEFFGRDAHVERELAQTFETGQTVCFNVNINAQGMPMVSEMSACLPDWQPTPTDVPLEIEASLQSPDVSSSDASGSEEETENAPSQWRAWPHEQRAAMAVRQWQEQWVPQWNAQWNFSRWNGAKERTSLQNWSPWSMPAMPPWPAPSNTSRPSKKQRKRPDGHTLGQAVGVIKSFNERTNYGFIECKELADAYGRDTFIHGKEFDGHYVGEKVCFCVWLGPKGQPQAYNVQTEKVKKQWDRPKTHGEMRQVYLNQAEERRQAGESFLLGIVSSYFPEKSCGFIECEEVRRTYGQEVYVFQDVLAQSLAGPGDQVAFYLHMSKQKKAQASHPTLRLRTGAEGTWALKGRFMAASRGILQIHCPEASSFFGCPVSVNAQLGSKLEAGSLVRFNITMTDGHPAAYDAEPCDETWTPSATPLAMPPMVPARFGKDGGKGKGKDGKPSYDTAVLMGRIKSFNDSDNLGFIECDLISSTCGCDAIIYGEEFWNGFAVGDVVRFEVSFQSPQPIARKVQRCTI